MYLQEVNVQTTVAQCTVIKSCTFSCPTFIQIGKSHMPPRSLTGLTMPLKKYQGSQFVSAHIKWMRLWVIMARNVGAPDPPAQVW